MPRELKIILFTLASIAGVGAFVGKAIETGSILQGILFVFELFALVAGLTILTIFFMWLGSKIWRE